MNAERSYYVYILASRHHGTLYIGVTNDIRTRLEQHRSGRGSKFVQQHKVFRLVHVETFATPQEAIAREKQLKFWKRDWKIKLIETDNPDGTTGRASSDNWGNGSWLAPGRPSGESNPLHIAESSLSPQ